MRIRISIQDQFFHFSSMRDSFFYILNDYLKKLQMNVHEFLGEVECER